MSRTVLGFLAVFSIALLGGCISIPEPRPMRAITYDFDKDKQQWTKVRCVTSMKIGGAENTTEMVCRREIIQAPPAEIEKRAAE